MVMLSHGLVSGALFLCVGVIYDRLHTREIDRYGGLADNMPGYACCSCCSPWPASACPAPAASSANSSAWSAPTSVSSWARGGRDHRHHPRRGLHALPLLADRVRHAAQRRRGGDARPRRARMVAAGADRRGGAVDGRLSRKLPARRCAPTSAACSSGIERADAARATRSSTAGKPRRGRSRPMRAEEAH